MHSLVAQLHAQIPTELKPFVPIEGLIDKAIASLVSNHLKNGGFTQQEQCAYDALTDERIKRMGGRPPPARRRSRPSLLSFFR